MKKQILTLTLAVAAMASQAQLAPAQPQTPGSNATSESSDDNSFKAGSDDNTFELNFTPFSGSPISLNYLRFRHFISDDIAIRAGFSIGLKTTSHQDDQSDAANTDKITEKTRVFDFAIIPGIEKHFAGTNRLSPYIGGELGISIRSAKLTSEEQTGPNNSIVTTVTEVSGTTSNSPTSPGDRGYFGLGLNGVIGCDFYFSKRIYMGLEAGFGLNFVSNKQISVTTTVGNTSNTVNLAKDRSFDLTPNVNSAIRIGFAF